MNPSTNRILQTVRSDIRGELYQRALQLEREGKTILKLNTGNPSAFGFPMPESVRNALEQGRESFASYAPPDGTLQARQAVLEYHRKNGIKTAGEEDVFLSNGVSEMAQMLTLALLNPEDEVLLPSPDYSLWENTVRLARATPRFYPCREEDGWLPDTEEMKRRITPKTKAILLINPNNPTGAVYPPQVVGEIARIAAEADLTLISDEIYDRLILDPVPFRSAASFCPEALCVTLNGLSKSHVLCGLRIGWGILSGSEEKKRPLREALFKLAALRLSPNAPSQKIVPAALEDEEYPKRMRTPGGRLFEQRRVALEELEKIPGVSFVPNQAAFYLFPKLDKARFKIRSDTKFCLDLLENTGILTVPSSGFAREGNDHFRLVLLPQASVLQNAIRQMGEFLENYRQCES